MVGQFGGIVDLSRIKKERSLDASFQNRIVPAEIDVSDDIAFHQFVGEFDLPVFVGHQNFHLGKDTPFSQVVDGIF